MKFKLLILGFGLIIIVATNATPVQDSDTESVDATTISVIDSSSTTTTEQVPISLDIKSSPNFQCTTTRGKPGNCTTVSECFTLVVPANGTVPVRNRVLAEMLVEASGFCDSGSQARSDISPYVMNQILREEILLCCPETVQVNPDSFQLDEIDMSADVYDEMFKGKSCGYNKVTENRSASIPEEMMKVEEEDEKILKGRKTKVGEYPFVVAMMNRNRQFCGGSLINQNTVLTAAHCVQHMTANDVKNMKIQIGDWDIYSTKDVKHVVRGAKAVKYHKGFSMKHLMHDIALLILDKPVAYSDTIQPVCLHSGTPDPADGKTYADVSGWGALSEGGPQPSDLRVVSVRVITPAECKKKYASTANKIGQSMLCAGGDKDGADSCQGDSGGPLTVDNKSQAKQIGVVSWGLGCGRYPGVYTAVYRYLNWINTNMVKDMGYE